MEVKERPLSVLVRTDFALRRAVEYRRCDTLAAWVRSRVPVNAFCIFWKATARGVYPQAGCVRSSGLARSGCVSMKVRCENLVTGKEFSFYPGVDCFHVYDAELGGWVYYADGDMPSADPVETWRRLSPNRGPV